MVNITYDQRLAVVWPRLFSEHGDGIDDVVQSLRNLNAVLDKDLDKMELKTGTISEASGLCLYVLTKYIAPKTVFEIGTFIGRSCGAIASAMETNSADTGDIYTCDGSNPFVMDLSLFKTPVHGWPKTKSTDALIQLVDAGRTIDLFHIDGRVMADDIALMAKLSHENTVFALDDFSEDVERKRFRKGVENAAVLMNSDPFGTYALVLPADKAVTGPTGINDESVTALLLPPSLYNDYLRQRDI